MHPILGDRRRLAIYVLTWLPIGVLLSIGLRQETRWLTAGLFFAPLSVAYAFVTLSAWYVCRAFPLHATVRAWNLLIAHAASALLAGMLWVAMARAWASGLEWAGRSGGGAYALFADQEMLLLVVGALLFWLASVFHYLLIAFEASRAVEKRALELSLLTSEAELRALRAQIDPHFIFNSLHSISALTASDATAARQMCLLLADFLRDTLRLGSNARISLAEELAIADRFLAIEQVRLGSRLAIQRNVEPEALECLTPPLLLQPLVENAVVHGIAQLVEGGTIRMAAERVGAFLTITVENPCDPDRRRSRGTGLGLELLRKRLTTEFGGYEAVRATESAGVFRVEVCLPAVTANERPSL